MIGIYNVIPWNPAVLIWIVGLAVVLTIALDMWQKKQLE